MAVREVGVGRGWGKGKKDGAVVAGAARLSKNSLAGGSATLRVNALHYVGLGRTMDMDR
jgi:hypothetical protein